MKSTSIVVTLAFTAVLGCAKPQSAQNVDSSGTVSVKPVSANVQSVMINVPTAKCDNCEATITKAVQKVDGVTDVKVNAEKHTAQVQFIAARATKSQIENAIAGAGYTADGVPRDSAAYKKLDACCQ